METSNNEKFESKAAILCIVLSVGTAILGSLAGVFIWWDGNPWLCANQWQGGNRNVQTSTATMALVMIGANGVTGTGFFVGPNKIVTAAHLPWPIGSSKVNVRVFINNDVKNGLGAFKLDDSQFPTGWGKNGKSFDSDYVVIFTTSAHSVNKNVQINCNAPYTMDPSDVGAGGSRAGGAYGYFNGAQPPVFRSWPSATYSPVYDSKCNLQPGTSKSAIKYIDNSFTGIDDYGGISGGPLMDLRSDAANSNAWGVHTDSYCCIFPLPKSCNSSSEAQKNWDHGRNGVPMSVVKPFVDSINP